jgi:hypothetical protein
LYKFCCAVGVVEVILGQVSIAATWMVKVETCVNPIIFDVERAQGGKAKGD